MPETVDRVTKELAGIAAAVAGHCQPCFAYHFKEALALGAAMEAIEAIVEMGQAVRAAGDRHMDEFVSRHMQESAPSASGGEPRGG